MRTTKKGKIESCCKYIMWGIKLEFLIPQTYLSFLCLANKDEDSEKDNNQDDKDG